MPTGVWRRRPPLPTPAGLTVVCPIGTATPDEAERYREGRVSPRITIMSTATKLIVLIGSMQDQYRHMMERARHNFTGPGIRCIAPYDVVRPSDLIPAPTPSNRLVNETRDDWRCVVDRAGEVVVVRKSDGTLGAGTVDELKHAMGIGKTIKWD